MCYVLLLGQFFAINAKIESIVFLITLNISILDITSLKMGF